MKRNVLFTLCKRFKKKKPKPPRDPPPTSSFIKRNIDRDFDPFVSSSQFETDPNRAGKWTKIDHTQSMIPVAHHNTTSLTTASITSSPDLILPRTNGIKTIAKFAQQEAYKHKLPPQAQIEIVAEDDNYIFVHKPAGIACHGTEEYEYNLINQPHKRIRNKKISKTKTFYELFMQHWYTTYPFFRFEPRLLHRLDANVSGVMVFGKKWCAEEHFSNLLHGNPDYFYGCGVKKCYLAVCKGMPAKNEGLIEGMIKKAHWNYKRFAIYPHKGQKYVTKEVRVDDDDDMSQHMSGVSGSVSGGSHIKTEFKVIDTCQHGSIGICSLIIFTIHTGKRHQIRASAAALNTPIIGDVLYGGSKYNTLLLHSLFIGFEGIIDTDLLYAVSCIPKWSHLSNHFWSTKAQYYTRQHLDFLMTVPRPSKKPRFIQYSMRKERAGLKRQLEHGKNQLLLPFEPKKEKLASDNLIQHTPKSPVKRIDDPLLDGAVPSHFVDQV